MLNCSRVQCSLCQTITLFLDCFEFEIVTSETSFSSLIMQSWNQERISPLTLSVSLCLSTLLLFLCILQTWRHFVLALMHFSSESNDSSKQVVLLSVRTVISHLLWYCPSLYSCLQSIKSLKLPFDWKINTFLVLYDGIPQIGADSERATRSKS